MFTKKTNNKINDWDIVLSSDVLTPIYDNEKQSYHLTMDNVINSINNSKIPNRILRDLMDVIEARSKDIIEQWYDFHNEIRFYC